ncbi:E3 ubiquitin/ISG15 ligase TRIM25-like [Micropterus salmoides]|uniref:E3 ubiquitin/ISG15 ligase TRIM25-like n=1 Tax=Micropterus salmoides TaxID=27706 RepID=UPI0018EE2AED|nr:E3 ubiquitin/ISG15 ligase TRIM25-like [Micropterus salmoides]
MESSPPRYPWCLNRTGGSRDSYMTFTYSPKTACPSVDVSAASCLLTEDQFLCSICLDVFTDPVSTPCGHNFCKTCITEHWNINVLYQCPNCKKVFNTKPELQVNTFISEMAAQFRQSAQQKASISSSEQQAAKPGEVPCDVCTGTKLKALKSCLVCLASYCVTHLEPHLTASRLKRHQLIDPVENLEGRMCKKHNKLLELFCKTDQMCVCMPCIYSDHKTHDVVPLKEGYEGKKAELGKTEAETQQMIQKRRLKIQEIKRSVELSKVYADREIAGGVQVFSALKESVERSQAELIDTIKEKLLSLNAAPPTKDWTKVSVCPPSHEGTVRRAVNQLEETLSELMKKLLEAELKRVQQYAVDVTLDPDISQPEKVGVFVDYEEGLVSFYDVDAAAHIYSFTGCRFTEKLYPYFSPCPNDGAAPPTKDWTEVSVRPPSYEGTVRRAVNQLEETLSKQMKKLFEAELKRVQQYAVDVTLDPDTTHPLLIF